jgi:hypothetical protein
MGDPDKPLADYSPDEKRELLARLLRERSLRPKIYPASFAQERLWFLDRLRGGGAAYNVPASVRLKGPLDLDALSAAIDETRRRHETLRTVFAEPEGVPVQVVGPAEPVPFPVIDLCGLPAAERETEARRLVDEEAREPFDLARGPLLRVKVLRLDAEEHVVMLTMHHIISDGWSMQVLIREVALLYNAAAQGRPAPLAALPIQYGDYARRQREGRGPGGLERQLAYWRRQLDAIPDALNLPYDRPRPQSPSFRGAAHSATLPEALTEPLRSLARRSGTTLFTLLCTAFKTLLAFYCGQDDVVVGTPVAGREGLETEGLIGFFVNTLVIRARVSGDDSFDTLLTQMRETVLEAQANQDLPFERLVEALRPARSTSRMPLFQVLFSCMDGEGERLELPGLVMSNFGALNGTAKLDLELLIIETRRRLSATFHYDTDLFEEATVARMSRRFESLLRRVVAEPGVTVNQLRESFAEAERRDASLAEQELTQARLKKFQSVRRRGPVGSSA